MAVARKQHKCDLCRREIVQGEDYFRQEVKPWDHEDNDCFFSFKAHRECEEVYSDQYREDHEGYIPCGPNEDMGYGSFNDYLSDYRIRQWLKNNAA